MRMSTYKPHMDFALPTIRGNVLSLIWATASQWDSQTPYKWAMQPSLGRGNRDSSELLYTHDGMPRISDKLSRRADSEKDEID